MLNLVAKPQKTTEFRTVQKSSFHTTQVACRYGRQNRSRPKKNFFRPNWRIMLNLENLMKHELDGGNQFNQVIPFFFLPNYPIGDPNIKRRKELIAPFDEIKKKYFDLFPDDRMTYLYDATANSREWYKPPVDRFVSNMARHLALAEKEMTLDEAFQLALRDKKYEEEARKIEFAVQKQQAEVLFGFEEKDWLKEQQRGNTFEEQFDTDPREDEKEANLKEQKLMTLVNQRITNPKKTKIKLADTEMTFFEIVKWLTVNPEYKQYFHESIYWGDVPYHELFLEDEGSKEQVEGDEEGDEGKYANPENDYFETEEQVTEESEGKDKLKLNKAKKAMENDTLIEDLNASMSSWAKDLLEFFSDSTDKIQTKEQAIKYTAAKSARNELKADMDKFVDRTIDQAFVNDADLFPIPGQVFKDGASEVLEATRAKKPYVSGTLEDELASLFRNVPGSKGE